jgi:hypothetical protein
MMSGSIPRAGSIGSPDRSIMVKPNGANTSPKKKQPRKGIGQRTVPENYYGRESQMTHVVKDRAVQNFQVKFR